LPDWDFGGTFPEARVSKRSILVAKNYVYEHSSSDIYVKELILVLVFANDWE